MPSHWALFDERVVEIKRRGRWLLGWKLHLLKNALPHLKENPPVESLQAQMKEDLHSAKLDWSPSVSYLYQAIPSLDAFSFPCTEAAVATVIFYLTPHHWNSKHYSYSGGVSLLGQVFCARFTYNVLCPTLVLNFQHYFEIIKVSTPYKIVECFPIMF